MQVFHTDRVSESDFQRILSVLEAGEVIGYPTDTAYGLGADPLNDAAVNRIFQIKGRSETKPILLIVNSSVMAEKISQTTAYFHEVARQFWPGPLTVVVRAAESIPSIVTAGTGKVGLRWPAADFATTLAERFGKPITATSANRSGKPAAVTADEVRDQLGDSIPILVDGGTLPARAGSTVLDLTQDPPVLLREGPVTFERLQEFFRGRIRR